MANHKTIKKQFELFLIPCSLEIPYFTRIPVGYCPEMRCRPTFELGYICCIWNVPRSWSILRFSFQTLRVDISPNIAYRTQNQPPKLPQFYLDYDSGFSFMCIEMT